MENNNMSNEEKFRKLIEEMRKLGNIDLTGEETDSFSSQSAENAEEFLQAMGRFGMNKAEKLMKKLGVEVKDEPAPEAVKPAEKKKSPDKDDMIGLIYEKYGCAGTSSEFAALIDSVTELVPDNEKLRIRQAIEQTVNAEAEAAFHAGFEAAKELLK